MKNLFTIALIFILTPTLVFSQSRKRIKKVINGATIINFYPAIEPFTFNKDFYIKENSLELKYITATSGTFTISEGDSVNIERIDDLQMPSQTLGIGGSVQFVKGDKLFHEISLTRLTYNKSSLVENYIYTDIMGDERVAPIGYKQKSFAIGMRYELGMYFGNNKRAKVRFGLSGGVESTFYRYVRTPATTQTYPIKARLFTIEVAVIPVLSAKLSKKLTMDFKIIPNFLTADLGKIIKEDPTLPQRAQEKDREFNLPEINTSLSVILRYNFKETKR